MRRLALVALLLIAACTSPSENDLYLHPEQDRAHPLTALADHVLAAYMAGPLHDGTTTCIATEDGREAVALGFEEEARLMARHISLASMDACALIDGRWRDADGDTAAHVIEVHGLSCTDAGHCTAFVRQHRADETGPDERYRMVFADGTWSITARGALR